MKGMCGGVMMNKEKLDNGRDNNRIPLYEVVPLNAPFTIGIGVSDFCNFKCVYCVHSLEKFPRKEIMISWEDFLFIMQNIEELYSVKKERAKNFSIIGIGEPLLHKRVADMVRYIKEHDVSKRIEITTNGTMLTHKLSDALIDAGLTRLLISIQGVNAEKYKKICGYDIDMNKFISEIEYFYHHRKQCKVYIKTMDIALDSEEEKEKFYEIFSPICDTINVENTLQACDGVEYGDILLESNRNITRYGFEFKERKCCDSLFMRLTVEPNGNVYSCACQWPGLSLGNIKDRPLKEIWNGELHKKYMRLHLEGKKNTIPRCAKCESMSYSGHPMDNLDEHMDEILKKISW